jgi:hypothetical protein
VEVPNIPPDIFWVPTVPDDDDVAAKLKLGVVNGTVVGAVVVTKAVPKAPPTPDDPPKFRPPKGF